MLTHEELVDIMGEAEIGYCSLVFWTTRRSKGEVLPKYINDHPDHPVWIELNTFQNGWARCKQDYENRE